MRERIDVGKTGDGGGGAADRLEFKGRRVCGGGKPYGPNTGAAAYGGAVTEGGVDAARVVDAG